MIEIIVATGDNSKRFSRILYESLSDKKRTVLYSQSLFKRETDDVDIVIIEGAPPKEIHSSALILVFTGTQGLYTGEDSILIEGNAVAIVSSEDRGTQEFLSNSKIKTITYGLSGRDTVTASSITYDNALIGIQRNLTAFSGKIIEPIEIPVELSSGYTANDMMIIATIELLIE